MQPSSRFEFREKYGGIPQDRSAPVIDPDDVPVELSPLIPLAEKWGIVEDDWVPQDLLREVDREEIEHLVENVDLYCTNRLDDPFNLWLGGPEASGPEFTIAYLAFTELRIVFDDAQWVLEHWTEIHATGHEVGESEG
jgi:hypothetical protein